MQKLIRVIGDPILHQAGLLFPENPTAAEKEELSRQIACAKSALIRTGGAGIAANQCAEIARPYCFAIVGVFYTIRNHAEGVAARYPNTTFPAASIMINPVITSVSTEIQQFNHGCLSVPCGNRCAVKSPMEMRVSYRDENMRLQDITVKGMDAVVLWHELTHILHGKTYMDVIFESLSSEDLVRCKAMLVQALKIRDKAQHAPLPEHAIPPFHFSVKIDALGKTKLDQQELAAVLPKMTDETLRGLLHQLNK